MLSEKIRVFINGFGRIGRSAARILLEDERFELIGINDLYSFEQMAYLFQYDSVYSGLRKGIELQEDRLIVSGKTIMLFSEPNPEKMDMKALSIDIVLQCTGIFLECQSNEPLLENGARKVIVSAPASDSMPTYIYGINHQEYDNEPIISNSSCSANAIVPIFKIVDDAFGIESAMMSMYHSYSVYQNLLDAKHHSKDIRRTRSSTQNILPLMSSAAEAVTCFFPHLKGLMYAKSIRVPVPAVTLYELHIQLSQSVTSEEVNSRLTEEIALHYSEILDTTMYIDASDSYVGNPYSAVINLPVTTVVERDLLRISAWQDNEYSYAKRLIDMAFVAGSR
jgi:glyceraldehyde 3-phosphate dehydrogenase